MNESKKARSLGSVIALTVLVVIVAVVAASVGQCLVIGDSNVAVTGDVAFVGATVAAYRLRRRGR